MKANRMPTVDFKVYDTDHFFALVYAEYVSGGPVTNRISVRSACPLCERTEASGRKCSWNFFFRRWYCHGCGKHGDALEMVQQKRECSVMQAARWLEQKGGPTESGLQGS